jgi:CelD/BcsL family acetyltransferase involved in cellulose biosynthesis
MRLLNKIELLEFVRERPHLFDAAGYLNPFTCTAWTLHFIEQIAENEWMFVVPEYLVDGDSLMLLYSERSSPHRKSAVTNYYASLYSPLISSARDRRAALGKLVQQLVELRPRCASINFAPLDKDSPDTAALSQAFSEHGWYVKRYSCFGNWYLPCTGLSFEEYMNSRDSKLYNTWARKSKKFRVGGSGAERARLEIITDPKDTDRAIDAYERVYAKSWKKPEPYPDFVRGWANICARNDWLRLGLAWVNDIPVAAQFWFTMHHRACIFKLAYDEDYSKLSAGTVLTAHLLKHSLDQDHVMEIDYLTGDDAYKQSWMTHRRERIGLLACNPHTPRGLLISLTELAGELRQRWRGSVL